MLRVLYPSNMCSHELKVSLKIEKPFFMSIHPRWFHKLQYPNFWWATLTQAHLRSAQKQKMRKYIDVNSLYSTDSLLINFLQTTEDLNK